MNEVEYIVSTHLSKFIGYQSKKQNKGYVKIFISTLWNDSRQDYYLFVLRLIWIQIHERICLERAFQKIRIKGGMCKPCCVENCSKIVYKFLLDTIIDENDFDY